jgi:hypothetical protein
MAVTPRAGGILFQFTSLPPGGGGVTVQFHAYLNSITDNSTGTWAEHMDMGRGDPKYMYSQYTRAVSVNFKTAALSPGEDKTWLEALNTLTRMTKPIYKDGIGFNGVLCEMIIGEFIKEIGILDSVDISVDNETPWIDAAPLYIDVTVSFKVIGRTKPDYAVDQQGAFGSRKYGSGLA